MTSHGSERPVSAGPMDEETAPSPALERCDWDDPLTRLLLLLEIADRPSWLRDV